jgi:1-acyl-sn-glycerol-3-phosphate acyltransferase
LFIKLAEVFCGIKPGIEGEENIPKEPFIIAAKHLSIWEGIFFAAYFKNVGYISKKSIIYWPIIGWYMLAAGMIPVDRNGGSATIKEMVKKARNSVKNQKRVLIFFPQGTRTPINASVKAYPYKKGIAEICSSMPEVPILPAAHNASEFFGRSFLSPKRPGTITIKFLPAIKKGGKSKEEFLEQIKNSIEGEMKNLFDKL